MNYNDKVEYLQYLTANFPWKAKELYGIEPYDTTNTMLIKFKNAKKEKK
jgi:hypothetical protein